MKKLLFTIALTIGMLYTAQAQNYQTFGNEEWGKATIIDSNGGASLSVRDYKTGKSRVVYFFDKELTSVLNLYSSGGTAKFGSVYVTFARSKNFVTVSVSKSASEISSAVLTRDEAYAVVLGLASYGFNN